MHLVLDNRLDLHIESPFVPGRVRLDRCILLSIEHEQGGSTFSCSGPLTKKERLSGESAWLLTRKALVLKVWRYSLIILFSSSDSGSGVVSCMVYAAYTLILSNFFVENKDHLILITSGLVKNDGRSQLGLNQRTLWLTATRSNR